ncbi:TetR/AcrR family transcriptional regulator [Qipengyuania flava]|uniref:TetR/AcrR family transcriptional regulator n=1 Tax=Qipengyuania flava TaxID=192812 RepID=UPI003C7E46D7
MWYAARCGRSRAMAKVQQKRVARTREKILAALEQLLESKEFEAISIADIARQGGVAVGSIYSHFEDKEALLPALFDRYMERIEARVAEFVEYGMIDGEKYEPSEAHDLRGIIEQSIRGAHRQVTDSLGLRRALLTYRRLNPDVEVPLVSKLGRDAIELLAAELDRYREEIVHTDLHEAARMVSYFLNIAFLDRIVLPAAAAKDELRPSDEMLIETYTGMVLHYLTGQ